MNKIWVTIALPGIFWSNLLGRGLLEIFNHRYLYLFDNLEHFEPIVEIVCFINNWLYIITFRFKFVSTCVVCLHLLNFQLIGNIISFSLIQTTRYSSLGSNAMGVIRRPEQNARRTGSQRNGCKLRGWARISRRVWITSCARRRRTQATYIFASSSLATRRSKWSLAWKRGTY